MRRDVALKTARKTGRPLIVKKCPTLLTSLSGDPIGVKGITEFHVNDVGAVKFIIVEDMRHEAIIGWDALHRFGFSMRPDRLLWGSQVFNFHDGASSTEIADISQRPPQIAILLQQYSHLFCDGPYLQQAKLPPLHLETSGPPIRQRAYRAPLAKRRLIDEEIEKMLIAGVIRPSCSPYASPMTLVPKKCGSMRPVICYQRLNEITRKDAYPLPLIQDIFDQMSGATVFSTLDMRSGYWQMPMAPDSIEKTAFITHRGQFEWLRVPFGLTTAPPQFQRAMNQVLHEHLGKRALVYLDDVIIFSKTPEQHIKDLEAVFRTLSKVGLTLKEKKCSFHRSQVDLLGFLVSGNRIAPQPEKVSAIHNMPAPRDPKEIKRFLGMTGYYRQTIPNYGRHAGPLLRLTHKGVNWKWTEEEQSAFNALKKALTSDNVMAYPDTQAPWIIYTDSSDWCAGAVLCQESEDGLERPVHYFSKQYNPVERRYSTIEKEGLALVSALHKFRPYLLGAVGVTVYTDHKPLLSLFTKQMKNTKIQRWAILVAELGVRVRYRPGPNNVRADFLSRLRPPVDVSIVDADAEWLTVEDVNDYLGKPLPLVADNIPIEDLMQQQATEFSTELEDARVNKDSRFLLHEGLLFSKSRPHRTAAHYPRLLLPSPLQEPVVARCHLDVGHMGAQKTMMRVQECYVWPGMRASITKQLGRCGLCLAHSDKKEKPPPGEMPLATCPGQIVGADLIGPFVPGETGGAKYLLTMIDHFSGWCECYPLVAKTNEDVWCWIRQDYVPRHGAMDILITDQGREFQSAEFNEWLKGMGVEHRRTTPYHPEANGKTERLNRTIKSLLRKLINGNRSSWEDEVGPAVAAIRIATSSVTGYSPFFLHHARHPRVPLTRVNPDDPSYTLENRLQRYAEVMTLAREATHASRQYNRQRLQQRANAKELQVGDSVLVLGNEPLSLTAKWDFGFTVSAINGLVISVLHQQTGVTRRVHRDKVRLIDPDVSWDDVCIRPRRTRAQARPRPVRAPALDREDRSTSPSPSVAVSEGTVMDTAVATQKRAGSSAIHPSAQKRRCLQVPTSTTANSTSRPQHQAHEPPTEDAPEDFSMHPRRQAAKRAAALLATERIKRQRQAIDEVASLHALGFFNKI